MMKKILFILALLYCGFAFGQGMPNDSATGYIHYQYAKGIWYPKISGDRVVTIPADTVYSKNGIAIKAGISYWGNGTRWFAASGGRSTDTSNAFVNTIYRKIGKDSIFFNKGGIEYAIKDSVGSGGGSSSNTSIGSGYKIAVNANAASIKSLTGSNGISLDSATTGQIGFKADTLLLATKAWRQKGIDSVTALLLAKLNISDTSAMLAAYRAAINSKVDTARTLTINGVTYSLGANRTWAVTPTAPGTVYVTDFGADSIGVYGSALAFQTAAATGKTVIVPPGLYKLDSTTVLNHGQKIFGFGKRSVLKTSTIGGGSPFNIIEAVDSSIVDNLAFKGSGYAAYSAGPTFTYQNGVYLPGNYATVSNCYFDSISGSGIQAYHPSLSLVRGNKVLNCIFTNSSVGILDYALSEYMTVDNIITHSNDYGILRWGGNFVLSNSHIDYNVSCGYKINGSTNGDHGTNTNNSFNHNAGYAVRMSNIAIGELFTSCNFFFGIMDISEADNVVFNNCAIWTPTVAVAATSTTKVTTFIGGYQDATVTFSPSGTGKIIRSGLGKSNYNRYVLNADTTQINNVLKVSNLASGAGTYAVRYDPSDSTFKKADTTVAVNLGNSDLTQKTADALREYTLGYFNASGDRYLSFGKANYTEKANILINANSANHNGLVQLYAKDSANGLQISESLYPNINKKYTTLNQSSLTTTISNYMDSSTIVYTGATKLRYNFGKDTFGIKGNMPISASSTDSVLVRENGVIKLRAQSDIAGGGGGGGTVNSGTQYRLAYYATTGTAVSEAAAITASRALVSDANGVPTHATTTATEIGYVNGVTSAIQTQLNGKQSTITFGTGVQTALGVNIGSAGAPVLFNGAAGTPSSLVGTNITGTATGFTAGAVNNALSISAELISGGATTYNGSAAKSIAIQTGSVTNGMLAGSIAASKLVGTDITTTGTITTGGLGTGAVIGGVTMTLGSDALYDIYTRGPSGVLTKIAAGTDGYQLTTHSTTSAPTWEVAGGGGSGLTFAQVSALMVIKY